MSSEIRIWVSEDRMTLVTLWDTGEMEVATRPTPSATWGPPKTMAEERT